MGLFWARGRSVVLGLWASVLLIWCGPATAAENSPAPEIAVDVGRLAELLESGKRCLAGGDAVGLASIEKKLANLGADSPEALAALARLLNLEGRYVEAAVVLERALVLKLDGFEAQSELGQAYSELGCGNPQARRGFESLIAVGTTSPFGYYHLGGRFDEHKHPHEAEVCYRGAVARLTANPLSNPSDSAAALQRLGSLLYEQGKSTEAEAAFRQGLEKAGRGAEWRSIFLWSLGDASAAQNKPAQAKESFRAAVAACEPGPGCSRAAWGFALAKLGLFYAAQGRKPEAEVLANRLGKAYDGVSIDDECIEVAWRLVDLYSKLGRSSQAQALLQRMLAARGTLLVRWGMGRAEKDLAEIYQMQGQWAEAEELYLEAIETLKTDRDEGAFAGALDGLATVYEKEGKGAEAAAARRQAEALRVQGGKS